MKKIFAILLSATALLVACKTQTVVMAPEPPKAKPIQMILDSDFGSSTDDLFAIMMIHHYIDEGLVDLKGVVVDREGEKNAQLVDLFNTYYGHPDIPIGKELNGVKNPRCFIPYNGIVDLEDAAGQPLFKRSHDSSTFPEGYKLYRQILSQADDKSIVVVAIGFATTLAELFESGADEISPESGLALFEKKVKSVYIQSGRFESGDSLCGYNMRAAASRSALFYDKLPHSVDIIMSPSNIGDAMDYAPKDVLIDLSATEVNPIKAVYTYYTCDTGQRMWDTNCLVNAVLGDGEYHMSPRGWVEFVDRGRESLMLFTPDPNGNARYQLPGDSYFAQNKLFDIRRHTRMVPNRAPYTIEAPQPQYTRHQAAEWVKPRLTQLVDKYVGSAGNDLDPNEVRALFRPLGFTGPNYADFDEANQILVDAIYDRMLAKAVRMGRKDLLIVSGPPACGKSFVVRALNARNAGLIYDADLSSGTQMADAIRKAKAAGMEKITIVPVFNDPLTCYKNSINRGNETWRYTTMEQLVASFRANVGRIAQLTKEFPDVEIKPFDCSHNQGAVPATIEEAAQWDYSVTEVQLAQLYTYLLGLLNEGQIEPNSVPAATGDILSIATSDAANQALAKQICDKKNAILQEYKMR